MWVLRVLRLSVPAIPTIAVVVIRRKRADSCGIFTGRTSPPTGVETALKCTVRIHCSSGWREPTVHSLAHQSSAGPKEFRPFIAPLAMCPNMVSESELKSCAAEPVDE